MIGGQCRLSLKFLYEKVLDFNDKIINLKIKNKKIITSKRDKKGISFDQFRKEINSL